MGDDQRQHLELARQVAIRFNHRFGATLVVPEAAIPATAARVMDLQHPENKMSKSVNSPLGTILMLDEPAEIERKVKKAVTDTDGEVRYDPERQAGRVQPLGVAGGGHRSVTDRGGRVLPALRRSQGRRGRGPDRAAPPGPPAADELAADPGEVTALLSKGADKARVIASATYRRAGAAIGLLAPE